VRSIRTTQNGGIAFNTTHWSVVLAAQDETPAAKRALEILCRTYWRPLYGFVRRRGLGREEAQDLVQEFFARLLEHRNLDTVRREKGRLRSYLLVSLKRFLASEQHRASGVKRYEMNLTTDYPDNIRLRTGLRRDRRIFWSAALLRRFLLPTNDAKYRNT